MFSKIAGSLAVVASLVAVPAASQADPVSPIFGTASVKPTTDEQNKSILGKGYYADMYGSYGIDYADYASYNGYYGNYDAAASYAYHAYEAFNAASYYQSIGY